MLQKRENIKIFMLLAFSMIQCALNKFYKREWSAKRTLCNQTWRDFPLGWKMWGVFGRKIELQKIVFAFAVILFILIVLKVFCSRYLPPNPHVQLEKFVQYQKKCFVLPFAFNRKKHVDIVFTCRLYLNKLKEMENCAEKWEIFFLIFCLWKKLFEIKEMRCKENASCIHAEISFQIESFNLPQAEKFLMLVCHNANMKLYIAFNQLTTFPQQFFYSARKEAEMSEVNEWKVFYWTFLFYV